ncbi:hypothetical protein HPULCUR_011167 [Helicostylum pulchrum]|uniref:Uncharacterized protein n=1 Tax=Helicostylum pulchrum TaxID=562976 RepID=A0ABP9YFB0_9FUNG
MKEQDEENNNVVHDDYADNDFADTDDENIMEYNMETDDEVELVMDVRKYPKLQPTGTIQQQQKTTWPKKQRNQFFRHNNPSKKQMELATRTFEDKIEDNKFINKSSNPVSRHQLLLGDVDKA